MNDNKPVKAWYKQFWPWFLIALPMSAVIGSMITINIAFTDADGLVKDDYYKEGLAMNMDIARKQTAEELGIGAFVQFNLESGELIVEMNDAAIGNHEKLMLNMIHPTRSGQDMSIELTHQQGSVFQGKLAQEPSPGKWWVRLSPLNDSWYVEGRNTLPTSTSVNLR